MGAATSWVPSAESATEPLQSLLKDIDRWEEKKDMKKRVRRLEKGRGASTERLRRGGHEGNGYHGTSSCHMAVVSATTVIQHWASPGGYTAEWHGFHPHGAYPFDKSLTYIFNFDKMIDVR